MGGCGSTMRQWKEDAQRESQEFEVVQPPQAPRPLHHDQPAGYVASPPPSASVAVTPGAAKNGHPAEPASSLHKSASNQWYFRKSQEIAMMHLVRHPRLQPFQQQVGQFGLDAAYTPIKLLGRGGTGQTWLCQEVATGKEYALKLQQRPIPRSTVRLTYNEVTIQASTCVSSVHMSHIREVMLTPSHLAFVLEIEAGGSAAEFVAEQIPKVSRLDLVVDEDTARYMFKQLVVGLEHLHDNHVAHRDVKLDNTLLDGQSPPTVKLCDFQFAKYWGKPQLTRMQTHLGTAVYMAPELIENRQNHVPYDPVEVDVWAAGIWLVALLLGAFPFDNRPGADDTAAEMQILHQEMSGVWSNSKFVRPYIRQLSPECVDLLDRILHVDPQQRMNLDDIQAHPWMRRPLPPHLEAATQRIRRAQMVLERRLAQLTPDNDLVHQRNSRVYDLVREAAAPVDQWEQSYHRLQQVCRMPLVDCASIAGVVRIDMQPEAVAKRISEKALSLLDASSPAVTPRRFTLPLYTIPSDPHLVGMVRGGGGSAEELAPPQPFAPQRQAAAGRGSSSSKDEGAVDELQQLSPFAAPAATLAVPQ